MFRPNPATRLAVSHPWLYSALTAVAVVALALGSLGSNGMALGAVVGAVMFVLNLFLWREGGPGYRWYRRRTEAGDA